MADRAVSGKLVVAGIVVLAIGGTYLLNVVTRGTPAALKPLLESPTATPSARAPRGTVVVTPSSAAAASPGVAYPLSLTTPCGMAGTVDFDGSFWVPRDGRSFAAIGRALARPVDPSTITLQSADTALVRTASGQSILLLRSAAARLRIPDCH